MGTGYAMQLTSDEQRKYSELRTMVDSWMRLGEKNYSDGTRWIAHTPHRAPEAYLHQLFGPLDTKTIDDLQNQLKYHFPESLKHFFLLHNGLGLFCGFVDVYGLRRSWGRTNMLEIAQQPYSIMTPNVEARPYAAPDEVLFVGSLGDDYDLAGIYPDGVTALFDRQSGVPKDKTYANVFDFVLEEAKAALPLFDDFGRRLDQSDLLHLVGSNSLQ